MGIAETLVATAVVGPQWCRSAVQYHTSHTAFHRLTNIGILPVKLEKIMSQDDWFKNYGNEIMFWFFVETLYLERCWGLG